MKITLTTEKEIVDCIHCPCLKIYHSPECVTYWCPKIERQVPPYSIHKDCALKNFRHPHVIVKDDKTKIREEK